MEKQKLKLKEGIPKEKLEKSRKYRLIEKEVGLIDFTDSFTNWDGLIHWLIFEQFYNCLAGAEENHQVHRCKAEGNQGEF